MFKKTLCQVSEKDGPGGLRGELPQRGRLHENGVQRPGYGSGKRALFLIRRFLKGPAYRGHAVCFDENAVSRSGFGGMLYGRIPPHIRADGDVAAKADIVLQAVLTGIPVDEIGVGIFQENARDPRLLTLGMEDDRPAKRCGERELPPEYTLLDGEGDAAPDAVGIRQEGRLFPFLSESVPSIRFKCVKRASASGGVEAQIRDIIPFSRRSSHSAASPGCVWASQRGGRAVCPSACAGFVIMGMKQPPLIAFVIMGAGLLLSPRPPSACAGFCCRFPPAGRSGCRAIRGSGRKRRRRERRSARPEGDSGSGSDPTDK